MQAIRTKYFGPTNTRGSRIQASCEARTIYMPYDHSLNPDGNHKAACEHLMRLMTWTRSEMVGGWHDNACYWVFTSSDGDNRTNVNGTSEVAA